MATETQVIRLAATLIGEETDVVSINDDRFIARTFKNVWDSERRSAIREGSWNFAARRAQLVALAAPGEIYPFAFAFQEPADSLRLIEVLNLSARDRYQLEGGRILCDVSGPLYVRYAADVSEPAAWDDAFAAAFAARLAWKCGGRIAGSVYDTNEGWRKYQAALQPAMTVDARENPGIAQEDGSWIEARLAGVTGDPGRMG